MNYAPAQLINDARRQGVAVRGPDVNASRYDCTLERGERGMPEKKGRNKGSDTFFGRLIPESATREIEKGL